MAISLDKLELELKKAREKRTDLDNRIKALEIKYKEEENTQIHDMVHAANISPEQLAEIIRQSAYKVPMPIVDYSNNKNHNEGEEHNEI